LEGLKNLKLNELISKGSLEEAFKIIDEIVETNDTTHNEYLLDELSRTESNIVRNKIAVALSDLHCEAVVERIIELLSDQKTIRSRGTLLYALTPFDLSDHSDALVSQLLTGNLEVTLESYKLIISIKEKMGEEDIINLKDKCKSEVQKLETKIEILEDFINDLS